MCVALSSQKSKPQKCVLVRLIFGGNNQILKVVYVLIMMRSCFKQEATPPTVFDQPLDSLSVLMSADHKNTDIYSSHTQD